MGKPVFVLNGPNLNLLGEREPGIYGRTTLADIERLVGDQAKALGLSVEFRQTNHEGELVEWIHEAVRDGCGIILNAGAYTHTSVAVHDALRNATTPVVEVHLSNIFAREPFRHHSYVSPLARGIICGFGPKGYELALEALHAMLTQPVEPGHQEGPSPA
jgi:3-dehydroquinate dehydratase-2